MKCHNCEPQTPGSAAPNFIAGPSVACVWIKEDCCDKRLAYRQTVTSAAGVVTHTYFDSKDCTTAIAGPLVEVAPPNSLADVVAAIKELSDPPPPPPLKIEFSETKLYSASSELGLFRVREYNEDTGTWSLRYENLNGTPFTGALPADLTAVTAQVNVTRTAILGCAAGVPYYMRETARFDAETGALESELVDWVDSAGAVFTTAPAGFVFGGCPEVCEVQTPVGVVSTWG